MGRERRDGDLDREHVAQKGSGGCAEPLIQDLKPLNFSVMHTKGEETPMSVLLVQEPGSDLSSVGIAGLVC